MPTIPSPYNYPNSYHPWIRGYDFHNPLANDKDAQDHEHLEGIRLEKERIYAVELVDKRFIRMGFAPIRGNKLMIFIVASTPRATLILCSFAFLLV